MSKRKIGVVVGSRANYASIKSVMREIKNHPDLELQLFVGASALLERFGEVVNIIRKDGFEPTATFHMIIEGENPITMAKSAGLGLLEIPTLLANYKPEVVITVGDRFETISTAIATVYMNVVLAHTMGGEVTGTIDESVRHAVTKLAHIHFASNEDAAKRIIRMGEDPDHVHVVGCPRIDIVKEVLDKKEPLPDHFYDRFKGVGPDFSLEQPFLISMFHPVTTEYQHNRRYMEDILWALEQLHMPTILMWPNADAGSELISKAIRTFREKKRPDYLHAFKNLPFEVFIKLMDHCSCMLGNSSSAIRDGAFIGVPAVNIGTRQQGRVRGKNIIDVSYDRNEILKAIEKQLSNGKYSMDPVYGDGNAGKKISDILSACDVKLQKQIFY